MNAHDESRIARERAELEAADVEPRGRKAKPQETGGELIRVDFGSSLSRLQRMQAARGAAFEPRPDEVRRAAELDDPDVRRVAQRRARLIMAGLSEPADGSDQRAAWERVLRAKTHREAARPGRRDSLEAMATVARWQPRRTTMVLLGPPGTGKTVASWAALAALRDGERGIYAQAADAASFARWDEVLRRAEGCRLVVLNEAGEHLDARCWGLVAALINCRHDEGQRTLVTTNLKRADLLSSLGSRTVDRVGTVDGGQGAITEIALDAAGSMREVRS